MEYVIAAWVLIFIVLIYFAMHLQQAVSETLKNRTQAEDSPPIYEIGQNSAESQQSGSNPNNRDIEAMKSRKDLPSYEDVVQKPHQPKSKTSSEVTYATIMITTKSKTNASNNRPDRV